MELATAAVIGVFSAVVIASSLQLKTGWSPETGPQAGYMPLRLGIFLFIVSVLLFIGSLRSEDRSSFVSKQQLKLTLAIFIPTVVLLVAMPFIGCYVGSLLYLIYMLKVHGHASWLKSLLIPICVIVAFFLVFELWFEVELVKGPVEAFFGL